MTFRLMAPRLDVPLRRAHYFGYLRDWNLRSGSQELCGSRIEGGTGSCCTVAVNDHSKGLLVSSERNFFFFSFNVTFYFYYARAEVRELVNNCKLIWFSHLLFNHNNWNCELLQIKENATFDKKQKPFWQRNIILNIINMYLQKKCKN